jgi:hypothetical protein
MSFIMGLPLTDRSICRLSARTNTLTNNPTPAPLRCRVPEGRSHRSHPLPPQLPVHGDEQTHEQKQSLSNVYRQEDGGAPRLIGSTMEALGVVSAAEHRDGENLRKAMTGDLVPINGLKIVHSLDGTALTATAEQRSYQTLQSKASKNIEAVENLCTVAHVPFQRQPSLNLDELCLHEFRAIAKTFNSSNASGCHVSTERKGDIWVEEEDASHVFLHKLPCRPSSPKVPCSQSAPNQMPRLSSKCIFRSVSKLLHAAPSSQHHIRDVSSSVIRRGGKHQKPLIYPAPLDFPVASWRIGPVQSTIPLRAGGGRVAKVRKRKRHYRGVRSERTESTTNRWFRRRFITVVYEVLQRHTYFTRREWSAKLQRNRPIFSRSELDRK